MTPPIARHQVLYADTTLFCHFEGCLKSPGLRALLDYFDLSLKIVGEVHRELQGLAHGPFPGVDLLKLMDQRGEYMRSRPVPLTPAMSLEMVKVAPSWGVPDPGKPKKNYGEVATVLVAARDRAPVVLDDRDGRKYAGERGVGPIYDTRDVVAAMVSDRALSASDGLLVWDSAFRHQRGRKHFDLAVSLLA